MDKPENTLDCCWENHETSTPFRILASLFLISLSVLLYQIIITRVFSAILYYHYVFLVTSFAIFGLGLGAMIVYKFLGERAASGPDKVLGICSFTLSVSYILVSFLIFLTPYLGGVLPYIILGIIPFVIAGIYISTVFRIMPASSGKLYFADLAGSAIGSVAVVILLDNFGIARSLVLISILSSLGTVMLTARKPKSFLFTANIIFTAVLSILLFQSGITDNLEKNFRPILTAPSKTISRAGGAEAGVRIVFTKWNSFSRTDVIEIPGLANEKIVTIDGAANAPMYRFDGDFSRVSEYKNDIEYFF